MNGITRRRDGDDHGLLTRSLTVSARRRQQLAVIDSGAAIHEICSGSRSAAFPFSRESGNRAHRDRRFMPIESSDAGFHPPPEFAMAMFAIYVGTRLEVVDGPDRVHGIA
jgi:hypothetical protein